MRYCPICRKPESGQQLTTKVNDVCKCVKEKADDRLRPTTCSPLPDVDDSPLTEFEKGPWSYDLYAGGLEPVGLLNDHTDEAQGEWVDIEDYRRIEGKLNALRREMEHRHKTHVGGYKFAMKEMLQILNDNQCNEKQ